MEDGARVHRPGLEMPFITGYAESTVLSGGNIEHGVAILTKQFPVENLAYKVRERLSSQLPGEVLGEESRTIMSRETQASLEPSQGFLAPFEKAW
jgi:hypothetical protein